MESVKGKLAMTCCRTAIEGVARLLGTLGYSARGTITGRIVAEILRGDGHLCHRRSLIAKDHDQLYEIHLNIKQNRCTAFIPGFEIESIEPRLQQRDTASSYPPAPLGLQSQGAPNTLISLNLSSYSSSSSSSSPATLLTLLPLPPNSRPVMTPLSISSLVILTLQLILSLNSVDAGSKLCLYFTVACTTTGSRTSCSSASLPLVSDSRIESHLFIRSMLV